ncbi:uncharacterized protein N7498_000468 [Penicillium cinerascens]|uniref:Uncharacterized protein n=1 Tax=Penicillium cinerascens TaxID=70096 RepID=A0A9W9NEG5_9EURO|nr:uncharacterized protein N7498_000468 [Penicillium cinerascens]KAJ5218369.1 hypothetical protein N7498_000468 [Penicillium cinerascens]
MRGAFNKADGRVVAAGVEADLLRVKILPVAGHAHVGGHTDAMDDFGGDRLVLVQERPRVDVGVGNVQVLVVDESSIAGLDYSPSLLSVLHDALHAVRNAGLESPDEFRSVIADSRVIEAIGGIVDTEIEISLHAGILIFDLGTKAQEHHGRHAIIGVDQHDPVRRGKVVHCGGAREELFRSITR